LHEPADAERETGDQAREAHLETSGVSGDEARQHRESNRRRWGLTRGTLK
jgi:hypothetical protein